MSQKFNKVNWTCCHRKGFCSGHNGDDIFCVTGTYCFISASFINSVLKHSWATSFKKNPHQIKWVSYHRVWNLESSIHTDASWTPATHHFRPGKQFTNGVTTIAPRQGYVFCHTTNMIQEWLKEHNKAFTWSPNFSHQSSIQGMQLNNYLWILPAVITAVTHTQFFQYLHGWMNIHVIILYALQNYLYSCGNRLSLQLPTKKIIPTSATDYL